MPFGIRWEYLLTLALTAAALAFLAALVQAAFALGRNEQ
jgi:hypothetical protein